MGATLLLLLANVAAASSPERLAAQYPAPLTVAQQGGHWEVVDTHSRSIAPSVALELLGFTEERRSYRSERRLRKALAIAMWSGGGAWATFGLASGNALHPIAGLSLVGSGFGLLYGPSANRLDHWVTAEELAEAVEVYNAAHGGELSDGTPTEPTPAAPVKHAPTWTIDPDGLLQWESGRAVSVREMAAVLGPESGAGEYLQWRRGQARTWGTVLGAGAVLAASGLVVTQTVSDERDAGLGTSLMGFAMMAGGVVGLNFSNAPASLERRVGPAEREEAMRLHNDAAADVAPMPAVLPKASSRVSVHPTVGIGYLGVAGTF